MSKAIAERTVMKLEMSEVLYSVHCSGCLSCQQHINGSAEYVQFGYQSSGLGIHYCFYKPQPLLVIVRQLHPRDTRLRFVRSSEGQGVGGYSQRISVCVCVCFLVVCFCDHRGILDPWEISSRLRSGLDWTVYPIVTWCCRGSDFVCFRA